jgi:hypothetical protein
MLIQPAKASANLVGLRVGGAVAGTLLLLLALVALIRPGMGMAMLHAVMFAAGF